MDITGMDITILVASTTGIILMSFAFPALGLTGDEATTGDVPNFDIETDRFDMVGDFPSRPSGPSGGTLLQWSDGGSGQAQDWITGGTNDGEVISLLNIDGNDTDPQWEVLVQDWDNQNVTSEERVYLNESETKVINEGDWEIVVTLDREYPSEQQEDRIIAEATYEIGNDPTSSGSSWFSGVPIVGDTAEGLQAVADLLVYIGNIFQWFVLTIVEFIWNMSFAIIEVVTFVFGLASFLVDTYASITSSEALDSWAQVILLIPGILFMIEWLKVTVVMINTIWIG